jgi:hypothetical protein
MNREPTAQPARTAAEIPRLHGGGGCQFRPPSVPLGNDLRCEQSREDKWFWGPLQTRPPAAPETPAVGVRAGWCEGRRARVRAARRRRQTGTGGGRASAILASCTALMGTAAAAAARSDRGWCEPGDTCSGPDHPGAAGRTAPRIRPQAGSAGQPSRAGRRKGTERVAQPGRAGHDRGQGGWYRGAAAGVPRPSGEACERARAVGPGSPPGQHRPGPDQRDDPREGTHHAAPR